eukprot:1942976-Prorocentrum_lima.AAC.1
MTSSLVGSEMCIRDRGGLRFVSHRSCTPQLATSPARGASHLSRDYVYSVSYTHLTLPTICSV